MDTGFSIIYKDFKKTIKAIIHKPFGFGPRYDSSIINSKPRFSPWNMVGEVVLEEVLRVLPKRGAERLLLDNGRYHLASPCSAPLNIPE